MSYVLKQKCQFTSEEDFKKRGEKSPTDYFSGRCNFALEIKEIFSISGPLQMRLSRKLSINVSRDFHFKTKYIHVLTAKALSGQIVRL